MKRKTRIIALSASVLFVLALMFAIVSAQTGNLVTNPGFESGMTGWTEMTGIIGSSSIPLCGSKSLTVTGDGVHAQGWATATFPWAGGDLYVSAFFRSVSGSDDAVMAIMSGTGNLEFKQVTVLDEWTQVSIVSEAALAGDNYTIRVGTTTNGNVLVDSVWVSDEANSYECFNPPTPDSTPSHLDLDMGDMMAYAGTFFGSLFPIFATVTGWAVGIWLIAMLVGAVKNAINGMR